MRYFQKDKFNRIIGLYKNGIYDTVSKTGSDIQLTIDGALQQYGQQLMANKRGGLVAIEPKSGEILALVTAPSYNPNELSGKKKSSNYTRLYRDSINKPLYDRGLLAEYPLGSPFKILTGLTALQQGVIDENTSLMCNHGYAYGRGGFMKCHGFGPHQLRNGISRSCNAYFAQAYLKVLNKGSSLRESVNLWQKYMESFGLNQFIGADLPTGRKGKIPSAATYDRMYPSGGWKNTALISNSIGQGEVLMTPIQLANMMAAVANQGYYFTPHVVKKIGGLSNSAKYAQKHITKIDKKIFQTGDRRTF